MMLVVFLGAILLTSVVPICFHKKDQLLISFNQMLLMALIAAVLVYAFWQGQHLLCSLNFVTFNHISLTLSLRFDSLTKIMMIFILVLGLLIYRYAQRYLESDNTRLRFLSQFNLVLFSVALLVMANNLLTAFVAWQLIGINLYILLNHYHYDSAANRAAKKKFVINRIGDCTFLMALILAYHSGSADSFSMLRSSPDAGLICGLLFVSVMTKCAQFPFHIWLIDTMETPTPVSALMHAGVINAGGILLTRISGALMQFHYLAYVILFVGLLSAVLSIHWMNQQPDTKKKFAYSTMGQMGYMLTQCSLGAFPAAVFHLISHGFYKASLFLNAGESLRRRVDKVSASSVYIQMLVSTVIAAILFTVTLYIFRDAAFHVPVLMYGFIFITVITMVFKVNQEKARSWLSTIISYVVIFLLLQAYFLLFSVFSGLLRQYEFVDVLSTQVQFGIIALFLLVQYVLWAKKSPISLFHRRDNTEAVLRGFVLNPLRVLGDIVNSKRWSRLVSYLYKIILFISVVGFLFGLLDSAQIVSFDSGFLKLLIFVFLLIALVALVIANRCLSIVPLIVYLLLFEIAFTNVAFFDGSKAMTSIGFFHIINICAALVMLYMLSKVGGKNQKFLRSHNRLPSRVFYLTFCLLLFIGIPGTASFISEFYLFSALLNHGVLFVVLYISLIILISIVVMHSLQLYAFNKNYSQLLSQPISGWQHVIYIFVIALNIVCGVFPNLILSHV